METLQLSELKSGLPGISPIEGANLYENCVVALHNNGLPCTVVLSVEGLRTVKYSLLWEDTFSQQLCANI